jgi:hypothetical protein
MSAANTAHEGATGEQLSAVGAARLQQTSGSVSNTSIIQFSRAGSCQRIVSDCGDFAIFDRRFSSVRKIVTDYQP